MHSSLDKSNYSSYQDVYPCPVCRLNQLQAMPLMDAMACECCNHIFTVDWQRQQIKMADRYPPLTWHWTGKNWQGAHLEGLEWGWASWIYAIALIAFPSSIVGFSAYLFPPDPNSTLSWLPFFWTGLTFLLHLAIVGWLIVEFYQFPVQAYLRMRLRRLFER